MKFRKCPKYVTFRDIILHRAPTLRVGIVKLSKYQITFLIEFTKSLREPPLIMPAGAESFGNFIDLQDTRL